MQSEKIIRIKERNLRKETNRQIIINIFVCFIIALVFITFAAKSFKVDKTEMINKPEVSSNLIYDDISEDDSYLLARIAMAEAEGCSIQTKVYVILTVLNRVESEYFPDTIKDVIFEKSNGVYQFTPICDGRWDRVEPNEECWEAVRIVKLLEYDLTKGALFFESCEDEDNWHSRNLEFLLEKDGVRFYK